MVKPKQKLTGQDVIDIRHSSKAGAELAREYEVEYQEIGAIRRGEQWAWLSEQLWDYLSGYYLECRYGLEATAESINLHSPFDRNPLGRYDVAWMVRACSIKRTLSEVQRINYERRDKANVEGGANIKRGPLGNQKIHIPRDIMEKWWFEDVLHISEIRERLVAMGIKCCAETVRKRLKDWDIWEHVREHNARRGKKEGFYDGARFEDKTKEVECNRCGNVFTVRIRNSRKYCSDRCRPKPTGKIIGQYQRAYHKTLRDRRVLLLYRELNSIRKVEEEFRKNCSRSTCPSRSTIHNIIQEYGNNIPDAPDPPVAKLSESDVYLIKGLLSEGKFNHRELGKMFGVAKETISAIATGRNWGLVKFPLPIPVRKVPRYDDETREEVFQLRSEGLSYTRISKITGVSQRTVTRWCQGHDREKGVKS